MYLIGTNATAPTFTPDEETRRWLAQSLQAVIAQLGAPALRPQWFTDTPARGIKTPKDLDGLFDFICAAQEQVGQSDLEFTLIDLQPGQPPVPHGFNPLGDATGHLLHSFARAQEIVLVVAPQLFRVPSLLLGHVARELGRLGLWQQPTTPAVAELDSEAAAELAGIALGMGTWVANGAYMFNNACCGGGCGIDLGSVRAALSMPEAVYALGLDAQRKGLGRRQAGKILESTQAAALKASWDACAPHIPALPAARTGAALRA
ncbi:MAG: hypothetical protein JNK56_34880 [Myxococcales bacterium]|nr:hypothetical protein [Myxococcales bacterium]